MRTEDAFSYTDEDDSGRTGVLIDYVSLTHRLSHKETHDDGCFVAVERPGFRRQSFLPKTVRKAYQETLKATYMVPAEFISEVCAKQGQLAATDETR